MGLKDSNYQVVYRYEPLPHYVQGVGCCSSGPEFMVAVSG